MTPVIFRKDRSPEGITAVFPTLDEGDGRVTCYAQLRQHSACSRSWYYTTKPATPDEYANLLAELVSIGYDDLKIYKRWTR